MGSGGFGDVLLCRWAGVKVAVKVMQGTRLKSLAAFLREARLLSYLRHPNIVQFLGISMNAEHFAVRV